MYKPSKGTELLNNLNNTEKKIQKKEKIVEEKIDNYVGVIKDGVEVVDVKNLDSEKKNPSTNQNLN